ncbi:MAG: prolipoprotein diacylglyceryl transferase [Flavipsychrobacter sp.]|nr:prolipoprotein diacylglyceryl transferase [Flavipsychrobacter sp.]
MYPDFQYLLQSLLGVEIPEWVGIFKTFGFLMALAFVAGAMVIVRELKRKEAAGLLLPNIVEQVDKKTGVKKKVAVYPHQKVTDIIVVAAIAGLAGAKIFNAFETWQDFLQNPIDNLFSRSGLTFYGGLIGAGIALYYYTKKYKISFIHFADAAAPALMLAYGVGRLGCHFSGDGDWGIFNSAYITRPDGSLVLAQAGEYEAMLQKVPGFFTKDFGALNAVPSIHAVAPSWLPDWTYAMNYAHNVNHEGVMIAGCTGNYCSVLPVGVFPTSLYEALACTILFLVIMACRKVFPRPLHLFGFYLILNGLERFFIEKIRVNYEYDWGFLHPSQAEIISSGLVLLGAAILLFYKPRTGNPAKSQ